MELVRIGELAKRSGVSRATLKFYLREGLIAPARKSGRTMFWYAPALIDRLRTIKDLQQQQFLPLEVIRQTLEGDLAAPDDVAAVDAIAKVLTRHRGRRARTRDEVLANGATELELDWLARTRLAAPDADGNYRGDDLALLSTLGAARKAGLAAEMLPFDILRDYVAALNQLVSVELRLFRAGVLGKAGANTARLTTVATELSERLVVLLRRKLLLPTLDRLIKESHASTSTPSSSGFSGSGTRPRRVRQQRRPSPANDGPLDSCAANTSVRRRRSAGAARH
jgi:DNA-binding transcriptional MerR regulator